ncbi:hypothetical protein DFS34DRAFT_641168, partial [Phlyctochytrium arcticum]
PNQFRIEYTYSKYSILEYGRLWARGGIGLQMFPKEIRAFLASEYYLDIDMENAMFRLLKSLAEQLNLDVGALCPELIELIENRKQVLTQHGLSKTEVIRMIFTSNSKPRNTLVRKIHTFFYGEVVPLLTTGQYNYWSTVWEHVKLLRQNDVRANKEGCFLSLVYQTFENQCLTALMDDLKSRNFEAHVPIFDGALVLKSPQLADIPAMLKDCESYVLKRIQLEVVLSQKNFSIPSEFLTHWHLQVVPAATLLTKRKFEEETNPWDSFAHTACRDLVASLKTTNNAVSEVLAAEVRGTVVPTKKPGEWRQYFPFEGIWKVEDMNIIMRPVFDKLILEMDQLETICCNLGTTKKSDLWAARRKVAKNLSDGMGSTSIKKAHLAATYELLWDPSVLFDNNLHLLHGAQATVYDLDSGTFRPAEPTDLSTMSTGLPLLPCEQHSQQKRNTIEGFLQDITLGRPELIQYLLNSIASSLHGQNRDQQFYFWHGRGGNGKSLLIKLTRKAFGSYAASIAAAQVSHPNVDAQRASPALMALKHKRIGFLTELETRDLYPEFLKVVAGGDPQTARQLFSEQDEFSLSLTIFIALYSLPIIHDKTDGFWRKLVMVPFDAKFVDEPKLPNERLAIPDFEDKLLDCADTFLALLVKQYTECYRNKGVGSSAQPDIAKQLHTKYRVDQNIPLGFVDSCINMSKKGILIMAEIDDAFGKHCTARGVVKRQKLVDDLHDLLDQKLPPFNQKRQVWCSDTKKNVRGWKGGILCPDTGDDNTPDRI